MAGCVVEGWERLRVRYNGLLFLVAFTVLLFRYYSPEPPEASMFGTLGSLALFAAIANAFYCVGPVVEHYVNRFGGSGKDWRPWIFGAGVIVSVLLEWLALGLALTPF